MTQEHIRVKYNKEKNLNIQVLNLQKCALFSCRYYSERRDMWFPENLRDILFIARVLNPILLMLPVTLRHINASG